jgi:hypothetical protein
MEKPNLDSNEVKNSAGSYFILPWSEWFRSKSYDHIISLGDDTHCLIQYVMLLDEAVPLPV